MDRNSLKLQYDKFDTASYLNYYTPMNPCEYFFLRNIHKVFTSGKVTGDRVLDFACGPIVHRLGPASKEFSSLTYADFSENNRKEVESWLSSTDHSQSTLRYLFKFLAELEGFEDLEEGISVIENRIHAKANPLVFFCDLNDEQPMGDVEPFDAVFTGACLESACLDKESYINALKNIGNLIKPDGHLVISGFTGGDFYVVGDIKYPCLKFELEFTKKCLEATGYIVLDLIYERYAADIPTTSNNSEDLSNCLGCIVVLAKKKESLEDN